jgi:hypothetical protein
MAKEGELCSADFMSRAAEPIREPAPCANDHRDRSGRPAKTGHELLDLLAETGRVGADHL